MKRIHLICNAHIDPVWQWEWEEGAAEALSTFRIAAGFCEEYGDFVFNHNEALLYQWIEEYDPQLFERIRRLVKEGKWHIMGGFYLQPDCNMPSGEGMVRQALSGRRYFQEKFGVRPTTAINFDPFGHSRGLVQILAKSGYDSYLFCRPSKEFLSLPQETFRWEGFEGSSVMARRLESYNSGLGKAVEKIKGSIEACPDEGVNVCLWGVGNHGGGPSRKDLEAIGELKREEAEKGVEVLHSTPEAYFKEIDKDTLPVFAKDLNPWAPGCYTSQIRVKQKYRSLENQLFLTEKMCVAAQKAGEFEYPKKELEEAQKDLLLAQFHDFLPGSSIQPGEEMAVRVMDHGLEVLSRARFRAFLALTKGIRVPASDEIPILIYNPHPYPLEGDFTCEMMLWDQNWAGDYSMPQVYEEGKELPTQCEKEQSNLNLDWRKKVVFHGVLKPMEMNAFYCKYIRIPEKPKPQAEEDESFFCFKNPWMEAKISKERGTLDSYRVGEREYLSGPAFRILAVKDSCDAWGMLVTSFENQEGAFQLLDEKEGAKLCGFEKPIPSVRVIESGSVRTVIEALFGYGSSRAVIRYTFSKNSSAITVSLRLWWMDVQKMAKLSVPTVLRDGKAAGETLFGTREMEVTGRENVAGKYVILEDEKGGICAAGDSGYGSSAKDGELRLTLLRSPAYCGHPIGDRDVIPQDRYTPYMDLGERQFNFIIDAGEKGEIEKKAVAAGRLLNEPPVALSYYPSGQGQKSAPLMEIDNPQIQLTACKQAEDGEGIIIRLHNPLSDPGRARVTMKQEGIDAEIAFAGYEVKSFRVFGGELKECNLVEE